MNSLFLSFLKIKYQITSQKENKKFSRFTNEIEDESGRNFLGLQGKTKSLFF